MLKQIQFPIKGTFYYDAKECFAQQQLHPPTPLALLAEPSNVHDAFALQVWLSNPQQERLALLGYVPRSLTKSLHFCTDTQAFTLVKAKPKGEFLWLICQLDLHCSYWTHLKLLVLTTYVFWQYRLKLWFQSKHR